MLTGRRVGEARVPSNGRRGELVRPSIPPGEDEGGPVEALDVLVRLDLPDGPEKLETSRVPDVTVEPAEHGGASSGFRPVPRCGDHRRAVGIDRVREAA